MGLQIYGLILSNNYRGNILFLLIVSRVFALDVCAN